MPLTTPGRNSFSNTYSAIKQRQLLALLENALIAQLDLMPPGIVDTTSVSFYQLKAGTSFVYHGVDAILVEAFSKNGVTDSGASQPTTDITINGVSALTAPIVNAGAANVEVAGVVDTANSVIVAGDVIELSVVVGTNSDAEEMHVAMQISANT